VFLSHFGSLKKIIHSYKTHQKLEQTLMCIWVWVIVMIMIF